jgi:hypothetical protein
MKKINSNIKFALAVVLVVTRIATSAQDTKIVNADKLIFLDGTVRKGRITGFANEKIEFVHYGETAQYEFVRNKIEKIEYASGRTELLSVKKQEIVEAHVNSRNRVAVMPLTYIGDENESRSAEMRFQLQNLTVNFLRSDAAELKFIDAAEINAILLKNGIDQETIRKYTPGELARLLHVEYVITGSVIQDAGSMVTVNNSYTNRRQDRNHHDYHRERVNNRTFRNERTVTRQNIETQVSISIYNDAGENIYAKSRHSILTESDAYRNAIQYLLKRCPLYKR